MPLKYELIWPSPNADDTSRFIKDWRKRMHLWHLPDAAWFQQKVPLTPKIKERKKKSRKESEYEMQYRIICDRMQPNFKYPIW
jgi:hypothetical protein